MCKSQNRKEEKSKTTYKRDLRNLQIELVKLQRHIIKNNLQLIVIFEGRDASGKDGVIKRITKHLSPRETRVMALGKPSNRDEHSWYFRRYVNYLPSAQEMVIMNRSWYNRAGFERVMRFCSTAEYDEFMRTVQSFEEMRVESGYQIVKYYLDITKREQKKRLADRRNNPLKQWKSSPVDAVAVNRWDDYTLARNEILNRTSSSKSPWYFVQANDKKAARINVIRHILSVVDCPDKDQHCARPDTNIVFKYNQKHLINGALAS